MALSKVSAGSEMEKFSQKPYAQINPLIYSKCFVQKSKARKHGTLGMPGFVKCKAISMGE